MAPWMEDCALATLKTTESWQWPDFKRLVMDTNVADKFKQLTPTFLSVLIQESQRLGGSILDRFWEQLGKGCSKLEQRIQELRSMERHPGFTAQDAPSFLFAGVEQNNPNILYPILEMAQELFIHLGMALYKPDRRKSGIETPHSVSDIFDMNTEALLRTLDTETIGNRKVEALKRLVMKRDSNECLFTKMPFRLWPRVGYRHAARGVDPVLTNIIPNTIGGPEKTRTIKALAMFAGQNIVELLTMHLNNSGNVMITEMNAHIDYRDFFWGIRCAEDGDKRTYYYHHIMEDPEPSEPGPGYISLKHGDVIRFGSGPDGSALGAGPFPLLCNTHLALARVMSLSGAADLIDEIRYDADDSDFPHSYINSTDAADLVSRKLLLCPQIRV